MKTSKIIFISFFSIIGLFLLSFLIQVDSEETADNHRLYSEGSKLASFSHIVANEGLRVSVVSTLTDSIVISHSKNVEIKKPIYEIKSDTLYLFSVNGTKEYFIDVFCKNLKSVKVINTKFDLRKISLDKLYVDGYKADISIFNEVIIDSLKVKLHTSSHLWCDNSKFNFVHIDQCKSKADLNIYRIAGIKAELRDSSELSTWNVLSSNVQTDESSRYYSR